MKIAVVTIRVVGNPMYDSVTTRWLETYKNHKPTTPHELVVVTCDRDNEDSLFDDVATRYVRYDGGGWDCGTWLFASRNFDADLLVCCNSSTHFWKDGWLERFVEEVERHGTGLYGSMASYEYHAHIRTPCMVFQPEVLRDYPHAINNRDMTYFFECLGRGQNATRWVKNRGMQARLVTWDGSLDIPEFRKPDNIFRRGDQSNVLVRDRHWDNYEASSPEGKATLAKLADGL